MKSVKRLHISAEERRRRAKMREKQKEMELRKTIAEKNRLAEQNRQAKEYDIKRRAELEAQHQQEVLEKARMRKEAGGNDQDKENEVNLSNGALPSKVES